VINGNLIAVDDIENWPEDHDKNKLSQLTFVNCSNVVIRGFGTIDGQGYKWWWYVLSAIFRKHNSVRDNRGDMIYWKESQNVTIKDITLKNSPK